MRWNNMRAIILLIIIALTSCCKEEKAVPEEVVMFKKIPFDLANNFQDTIALKINPVKDYQYWAYVCFRQGMSGRESTAIIKEGGDTLLKKNIKVKQDTYGFFQGGHPNFRCNYIVAVQDGREKLIDTDRGFREFLGTIDNLEEAVLLAITYGYWLDSDIKGSAYRINNGNYEMHLLKFSSFPLQKESVEVIVIRDGFIKTSSLGVYCKNSKDCYE